MRETVFENNIHIYKERIAISVSEKEADLKDKIAASKAADRAAHRGKRVRVVRFVPH